MSEQEPASRRPGLLRHPLTNVVVGFLLTGVIGVVLAGRIQKNAEEASRQAEVREARRVAALSVADTVGLLLNRTYYLFGEYWDAVARKASAQEANSRRALFDSARAAFESRRFVDAARVQVHFGPGLRREYEMIADSLQFLVGNFAIARLDPTAIREFSPSVENVRVLVAAFLLRLVTAADSVAAAQ